MAVTINGTTGVVSPDGTAGTPSYQGGDSNTGMFFPAADTIAFSEGGAEVARFDSSGNLGLGTTAPAYNLDIARNSNKTSIQVDSGNNGVIFTDSGGTRYTVGSSFGVASPGNYLAFNYYSGSAWSERMRIDSNGNLCLGRTSVGFGDRFVVQTVSTGTIMLGYNSSASNTFQILDNGNVRNTNNSYGAISDAKLKENVVDATPKLEKLNQVRIVNFNLIGDEQKQIGVIAQELEQIFPGMVEESPDRDEEGNELGTTTKSVKYSVFVPMLIKAVQELTARVQALESKA